MRTIVILILVSVLTTSLAQAQGLDGPLSAPDVAVPAGPILVGAKHAKTARPKISHRSKAPTRTAGSERPRHDVNMAHPLVDDDRLSLGMKWNGSNDNAAQTRVQNYGGDAAGAGAAVGLKLHF